MAAPCARVDIVCVRIVDSLRLPFRADTMNASSILVEKTPLSR
jgi:hypothetical protein